MASSIEWMSAKLWSAVARNRFGSHLEILQTSETSGAVGFLPSSPEYRNGLPKRFRATALQRLPPILMSKHNAIALTLPVLYLWSTFEVFMMACT